MTLFPFLMINHDMVDHTLQIQDQPLKAGTFTGMKMDIMDS